MALDMITGGEAVIEAALKVTEILIERGIIKMQRKNLDDVRDIQKKISEERAKGYSADQSKIEALYSSLEISRSAYMNEVLMNLSQAKKD